MRFKLTQKQLRKGTFLVLLGAFLAWVIWRIWQDYLPSSSGEWTYTRCSQYTMRDTMDDVFAKYGIRPQSRFAFGGGRHRLAPNLYIPCGYDYVERELANYRSTNPAEVVFGLRGCDHLVRKESIWALLQSKFGESGAVELAPRTYNPKNPEELQRLIAEWNPGAIYIMKKNIQQQKGLHLVNQQTMAAVRASQYNVVQPMLLRPYCINGHKVNLRIYMLVVHRPGQAITGYIYNDGFVYYTPEKYNERSMDPKCHITTGYSRELYNTQPLTLQDFCQHIETEGSLTQDAFMNRVGILVQRVLEAAGRQLFAPGKSKVSSHPTNTGFQLFGLDVAPDEDLQVKLIEINKGPDMGAKDERDRAVKQGVYECAFHLVGIVDQKPSDAAGFREVWRSAG